jgi:HSP20 family molecular chaperone IbpA
MDNNYPAMTEFWEQYQRMMQDTMAGTQKLLQSMNTFIEPISRGVKDASTIGLGKGPAGSSHEIQISNDTITVTFTVSQFIDKTNTKIYLEGNYLIIDGVIQEKIPLPVAVQKYGGRAKYGQGKLEVILPRDKYLNRQSIPIEIG